MADRFYEIDGKKLPSVTTITGIIGLPWLANWHKKLMGIAVTTELLGTELPEKELEKIDVLNEVIDRSKKAANAISKEAQVLGTKIHSHIEKLSLGEKIATDEDTKIGVASWKLWRQESGMELVETERVVYDKENGYAGKCDAVFKDSFNRLYIIDYKTSSSGIVSDSYALQVAAYSAAYPDIIHGGFVLMLDKNQPNFKIHKVNLFESYKAFISALELYKKLKGGELWM